MKALRTVVLTLMGVLVVGGCSEDPEPRIETVPSPSVTVTQSPSVSPAPSTTPEAFIRAWFDVGYDMQRTGETAMFLSLAKACGPCDDLADSVTTYYESGGFIRPSPTEVLRVQQPQPKALDFYVRTRTGATDFQVSAEAEEQRLRGGTATYLLRLEGAGTSWVVTNFFLEPSS